MYKKILVPVDGSATSIRGLEEAIGFAEATGATLDLVHVVDEFVIAAREAPAVWHELSEVLRESGEKVLADAEAVVRKHNVPFTRELLNATGGGAAGAIVDQAKELSTDLIIMGTHGHAWATRPAPPYLGERCRNGPALLTRSRADGARRGGTCLT